MLLNQSPTITITAMMLELGTTMPIVHEITLRVLASAKLSVAARPDLDGLRVDLLRLMMAVDVVAGVGAGAPHHVGELVGGLAAGDGEERLRRGRGRGGGRGAGVEVIEGQHWCQVLVGRALGEVASDEGRARADSLHVVSAYVEVGHRARASELYGCNVVRLRSFLLGALITLTSHNFRVS